MTAEFLSQAEKLYDAYIFDLDGTLYLGKELLPGAKRLLEELRRRGIPVRFLSNNPTRGVEEYVRKLRGLGLAAEEEEITSTARVTAEWLLDNRPGAAVFPIGEAALVSALESHGIDITEDPERIDVVIASYDRAFEYRKLQIAFDAIWFHRRAELIATNPDPFCPFPGGRGEPDCAAITAAIEACTHTKATVIIGKPNPLMLGYALKGLDTPPGRALMVGDRLATDIAMGCGAGMDTAMPLTGEGTRADAAALPVEMRPAMIVERVDQILPPQVWAECGWGTE